MYVKEKKSQTEKILVVQGHYELTRGSLLTHQQQPKLDPRRALIMHGAHALDSSTLHNNNAI